MNRGIFFLYVCFLLVGTFCLKMQGADQPRAPESSERSAELGASGSSATSSAQPSEQMSLLGYCRKAVRSVLWTGVTFPQDLQDLRYQNQFLTSRVEDLSQEVDGLRQERDKVVAETRKVWGEYNDSGSKWKEQRAALETKLAQLEEKLVQKDLDLVKYQSQLRSVQEQLNVVLEENVHLRQQLEQGQREKEVRQQEVQRIIVGLQKQREESDAGCARLVYEQERGETNSCQKEQLTEILAEDNVLKSERIGTLEDKHRVLNREKERLQRENDRLKIFAGFTAGVAVGRLGCYYLTSQDKKS